MRYFANPYGNFERCWLRVIAISIIAILALVSIASADSPWVDFESYWAGVEFIDDFPRTATGKILKRILRKPYWEGQERQI